MSLATKHPRWGKMYGARHLVKWARREALRALKKARRLQDKLSLRDEPEERIARVRPPSGVVGCAADCGECDVCEAVAAEERYHDWLESSERRAWEDEQTGVWMDYYYEEGLSAAEESPAHSVYEEVL